MLHETFDVCSACGCKCEAVEGNPYLRTKYFGLKPIIFSSCCGEEVLGGKVVHSARHTARRDHKDGKVSKGDVYGLTVERHWHIGGASWHVVYKRVITPAHAAAPVLVLA